MITVIVVVILIATFTLAQPPIPPNAFSATVELTKVEVNTTVSFQIYYDYINQRARIDNYGSNDTTQYEVFYTDIGIHFTYDPTIPQCNVQPIGNDEVGFIINSNYTLRTPAQIFSYDLTYNYTWSGVQFARGILCDVWTRTWQFTTASGTLTNYTMDYYFTVPNWNLPDFNAGTQIPVRYHIYRSTWDNTTGTQTSTNHYIELSNFAVGSPLVRYGFFLD
jgi:hypothetical protein